MTRSAWIHCILTMTLRPLPQSDTPPEDTTQKQLLSIKANGGTDLDKKSLDELKKRKLTTPVKLIYYSIQKGPKYAKTIEKLETDLTVELLQRYACPIVCIGVQRIQTNLSLGLVGAVERGRSRPSRSTISQPKVHHLRLVLYILS